MELNESCSVTNNLLDDSDRRNSQVRVQIVPATPKTLSHLPHRPAVDLAFHKLSYRVKEGRRNSEYIHGISSFLFFSFDFLLCLDAQQSNNPRRMKINIALALLSKIPAHDSQNFFRYLLAFIIIIYLFFYW
jgi:hypothetical protein